MRRLWLTVAALCLLGCAALAADWYVPDDYATIPLAIAAASNGETIYVRPGIYTGNIVINKEISLVAWEWRNATLTAAGGRIVSVHADNVQIVGFVFDSRGGASRAISVGSGTSGDDVSIYENEFYVDNGDNAVFFDNRAANDAWVSYNVFDGTAATAGCNGLAVLGGTDVYVNYNTFRNIPLNGAFFTLEYGGLSSCDVYENTFENCGNGLLIVDYNNADAGLGNLSSFGAYANTFTDCRNGFRIYINNPANASRIGPDEVWVSSNSFGGSVSWAVRNDMTTTYVHAEENWWDDSSGPYHNAWNPDGLGDAVTDYVYFAPWERRDLGTACFDWDHMQAAGSVVTQGCGAPWLALTLSAGVIRTGPGAVVSYTFTDPLSVLDDRAPFNRFAVDVGVGEAIYFFDIAGYGFTAAGSMRVEVTYTPGDVDATTEGTLVLYYYDDAGVGQWVPGLNLGRNTTTNTVWCDVPMEKLLGTPFALVAPGIAPSASPKR